MNLRIVAWNCRMSLRTKIDRLMSLRPDVAIVPECEHLPTLDLEAPKFKPTGRVWVCTNETKGLGVFAFNGLALARHDSYDENHRFFAPVEVRGRAELNILGIWAFDLGTPATVRKNPRSIGPALKHYAPFLRSRTSIVAGDFNASSVFDTKRKRRFAEMQQQLAELGMVSGYHASTGACFGKEPQPTWFQPKLRPPYHIDYIYLPKGLADRARPLVVGSPAEWLSVSDHVPLVVEINVTG